MRRTRLGYVSLYAGWIQTKIFDYRYTILSGKFHFQSSHFYPQCVICKYWFLRLFCGLSLLYSNYRRNVVTVIVDFCKLFAARPSVMALGLGLLWNRNNFISINCDFKWVNRELVILLTVEARQPCSRSLSNLFPIISIFICFSLHLWTLCDLL